MNDKPERSSRYRLTMPADAIFIPEAGVWLSQGNVLRPNGRSSDLEGYVPPLSAGLLQPGERGAIVLLHPEVDLSESDLETDELAIHLKGGLDEEQLRFALLMFDKIVFPATDFSPEANDPYDLEAIGPILRPRYYTSDGAVVNLGAVLADTLAALDDRNRGRWAICRGGASAPISRSRLSPDQGFKIDLQNALPVFTREVPLEDVLAFKSRYSSEYIELRNHLEDIALAVEGMDAEAFRRSSALERLDQSLARVRRVAAESNWPKDLIGIEISFSDWGGAASLATGLWTGSLPLSNAVAAGSAMMAASISLKAAWGLLGKKGEAQPKPFDYLMRVERELR